MHEIATIGRGALRAIAALRISIGFVFLWAFLDKLLGLGFSTGRDPETGKIDYMGDGAWINGGSPTEGFLTFGLHTKGVFIDVYESLAGQVWVDWIYMVSMVLIGAALMLGISVRLAAIGGIAWMAMFYTASAIWPENNPVIDDHVVYAIALLVVALTPSGAVWGLGRPWSNLAFVRANPWLR